MLLPHLHYTCNDTSTVIGPGVHAITVIIDNFELDNIYIVDFLADSLL